MTAGDAPMDADQYRLSVQELPKSGNQVSALAGKASREALRCPTPQITSVTFFALLLEILDLEHTSVESRDAKQALDLASCLHR